MTGRSLCGKRVFDLALGLPAFLLTLPIQMVVAAAVAVRLGRPVFFRQVRPGQFGRPFTILKFRTMRPIDLAAGRTDDASRLTPFGMALRSSSLDELPALWNVLRGEMSLVGPRPLLTEYLDRYNAEQSRRHEVPPGLTGLAQVAGRNHVSWDQRLRLDVEYVRTRSLWLDLKILCMTVGLVLQRTGINAVDAATMPEFRGSAPEHER